MKAVVLQFKKMIEFYTSKADVTCLLSEASHYLMHPAVPGILFLLVCIHGSLFNCSQVVVCMFGSFFSCSP